MNKSFVFSLSLLLLSALSTGAQAHVGFSFGVGTPGFGFGFTNVAPQPCFVHPVAVHRCHHHYAPVMHGPVFPSVGFSVAMPIQKSPWKITNETSDFIEVISGNESFIIKSGRTKRIPRHSKRITLYAACNDEEITLKPSSRTFAIAENHQGDLVFLA